MSHTERCINNAVASAQDNMAPDATYEELRAEAINYLETGISDCYCS
jgi:hypothetical protein